MYSGSSDGKGHYPSAAPRILPPATVVHWTRGGSRIRISLTAALLLQLLYLFLAILKPEEGSISQRVQRLAKFRFLKKQTDLLLNADDLDSMWICLSENCVIDDATGAEKGVHQKWIEGGNYELCIEDVRDEIWDMVKPVDPLKITLTDLCKQGGTVASMLIDVRGFWAHDSR